MDESIVGMVLSAGEGRRLRPLTDYCPKPLIRFFGQPLLHHAADRLRKARVDTLCANVSYLHKQVERYTAESIPQMKTFYEPELLGSGGAFLQPRNLFPNKSILAINGDVFSTCELASLLEFHRAKDHLATMSLRPDLQAGENPVWCRDAQVVGIGPQARLPGATPFGFSGDQVLSPQFIADLPQGPSNIIDLYKKALEDGKQIGGFVQKGIWRECGTPELLWQAHMDLLELRPELFDHLGQYFQSSDQRLECGTLVRGSSWVTHEFCGHPDLTISQNTVLNGSVYSDDPTHLKQCLVTSNVHIHGNLSQKILGEGFGEISVNRMGSIRRVLN